MTTEPTETTGTYRFTDHSVLRPWVTQVWFSRLFLLLPRWLAANVVTLLSTAALASVIVGALLAHRLGPTWFALIQLVALQLYVAGDHLDGMQARASGTMSPLGDFLDHHCDLWAGCVLIFGFWSMMATAPLWELYALTIILATGFAITFAERAERKALHFTAWGTLEAIAILSAFYVSWCIPSARAWWSGELWPGWPRHMLVAALGAVMALGAIGIIAGRLRRLPAPLMLNSATLVALSVWCVTADVPPLWGWFAVTITSADYVALLMRALTTSRARPWPDLVAPVATVALWLAPADTVAPKAIFIALTAWLVARYAVTITRILSGWRHYWTWVNVRAETTP